MTGVLEVPAAQPTVTLRPAVTADTAEAGRILFEAFATLADRHGFPRDFPNVEVATRVRPGAHRRTPGFFGVVAEREGRIVGSTFLDERSTIVAVGPVSVDPAAQDGRVGRALMDAMLDASG